MPASCCVASKTIHVSYRQPTPCTDLAPLIRRMRIPELTAFPRRFAILETLVGILTTAFCLPFQVHIGAYWIYAPQVTENRLGPEATREQRRSERIRLSVPVLMVTETLEHKSVQEVTQTVTVNAHGGLFKLKMEVLAGQPMTLVNLQTNHEQRCRVVRVEQLPAAEFGVAFEFASPAPEFWSVTVPPANWNAVRSQS